MREDFEGNKLSNINQALSNLKLSGRNAWPSDDELTDITKLIDGKCKKLKAEAIIKTPTFDLFDGTHSLEINNKQLDTYLINLTDEEISFDCNRIYGCKLGQGQSDIQYVTAIVDRLVRSIISWLSDYQTLPTTVLSCRYIEYILLEAEKSMNLSQDHRYIHSGNELYDTVLNNSIIGICYFTTFVRKLLRGGGVFEEEDLNFNIMGLEGFDMLPSYEEVKDLLIQSIAMVKNSSVNDNDVSRLLHLLKLILTLVKLDTHLSMYFTNTDHLKEMIYLANYLDSLPIIEYQPPKGSFSMIIQKTLSNQFPPKELTIPGKNYSEYVVIANDIMKTLLICNATNSLEMFQFSFYFNKVKQRHVLARALFPLVLVRDDMSIIGKYTFEQSFKNHLLEFSLAYTNALAELEREPLQSMIKTLSSEGLNTLFEWYQNSAQNTARYRQGYNRLLLLWDSIQAQLEKIELSVADGNEDKILSDAPGLPDTPLMPFASWAFCLKTLSMIEFVLKGFDLDIYKPYEAFSMFWYAFYLSQQLEACLQKVLLFIDSKINHLLSLNKKIKKLKAGEKKDTLREQYHLAMEKEMPQLKINKTFVSYLLLHNTMVKSLCLFQTFQFGILKSYGVLDNIPQNSSKFMNNKLIHELRFKPFSSIGVPELPSYEVFQEVLNGFVLRGAAFDSKLQQVINFMDKELFNANMAIDNLLICISTSDKNGESYSGTGLVTEEALIYYQRIKTSIEYLRRNCKRSIEILGPTQSMVLKDKYTVTLKVEDGTSGFFPLMTVIEKKNRHALSK